MTEENWVWNLSSGIATLFKALLIIGALITPAFLVWGYYKWNKVSTLVPIIIIAVLFALGTILTVYVNGGLGGWFFVFGIAELLVWVVAGIVKLAHLENYRKKRQWYTESRIFWREIRAHKDYLIALIVAAPSVLIFPFVNNPAVYNNIELSFLWYFSLIIGIPLLIIMTFFELEVIMNMKERIKSYARNWTI